MKKFFILALFLLNLTNAVAQDNNFGWWNEQHGWKPGMPGWSRWMKISPGYLGPNALPVPEPKKGFIPEESEIGFSISRHFHPGDPTQDISGRLFIPFAKSKIAFEVYGVIAENYSFSTDIRNERFARVEDGKGTEFGDLYFSTLLQLLKDRKFPNTLLRMAAKTASGDLSGARYTDSPGYFFDLSFSKDIETRHRKLWRPYSVIGFYSWQTNEEFDFQNDAFMYGAGLDYQNNGWLFSGNFSGYSGYKNNRDKPQVATIEIRHDWERTAARVQLLKGVRDWNYSTFRFSFMWKFEGK